jgi:branched-chain amino acid transport system substrate-binding protein
MGHDAYYVALEALKAAGSTTPADVMQVLPAVTYAGVSGDIRFNSIGDAERDVAYVKHCDTSTGNWEFIAQQGV